MAEQVLWGPPFGSVGRCVLKMVTLDCIQLSLVEGGKMKKVLDELSRLMKNVLNSLKK